VVAAVFGAFLFFAVLAWESFGSSGGPSFFYPGAGVTAAAMMLSRRGLWPAIAAAVAVAEIILDEPKIVITVRQRKATGMAQHARLKLNSAFA
jgi:hypothetical protein